MVGRIAHGEHAFGQVGELRWQQEVLDEGVFHARRAGQVRGHARREVAVAQPARALARRAVHEHVQRVLAEGRDGRRIQPVEPLVAGNEGRRIGRRMRVLAQHQAAHLAGPLHADQLHVAHRVGLDRLQAIHARLQVVGHHVHAAHAAKVHVSFVSQDFVEQHPQATGLPALDRGPQETRQVGPQVQDPILAALQRLGLLRIAGARRVAGTDRFPLLQFERGRELQLRFRKPLQLRADLGQGTVLPELACLGQAIEPAFRHKALGLCQGEVGLEHAPRQERFVRLHGQLGRREGRRCLLAPAATLGRQAIGLAKRPLETVACHLLQAFAQELRGEWRTVT